MSEFISITAYAQKHKIVRNKVYRWIERGQFTESDVKRIKVKRYRIREDAKPLKMYKP